VADALTSFAVADLCAAQWTARIEYEWIRNLESNRPELTGRWTKRRNLVRPAVPGPGAVTEVKREDEKLK
jgi:hypothetical protein